MKNIPMLLLLLCPYLYVGYCLARGLDSAALWIWLGGCLLLLLPNMVYAFLLPRLQYRGSQVLFWNMLLKICHIPLYLLVFFLALFLHVLILPLLPLLLLFDYSLLLSTSMYGVSGILCCRRSGHFTRRAAAVQILLQLLFCLDVCSAVYCFLRARRAGA